MSAVSSSSRSKTGIRSYDVDDDLESKDDAEAAATSNKSSDTVVLERYLEQIDALYREEQVEWPSRTECPCCHAQRHMYCFDCCQLLVPDSDLPESIRHSTLQLPFDVDFLLADRRASSTGIQVASIFNHLKTNDDDIEQAAASSTFFKTQVRVIDLNQSQSLPDYQTEDKEQGTLSCILFPATDSVPLSSMRTTTSTTPPDSVVGDDQPQSPQSDSKRQPQRRLRLIVLDCKWRRFRPILDSLKRHDPLPLVHLDHPPSQSYYWRWHLAGPGCVSSAEAVFWAAWQYHHHSNNNDNVESLSSEPQPPPSPPQEQLLDMLWLFAVQRSLIQQKFDTEQDERTIPHVPFSSEAKETAGQLRHKQKLQHIQLKQQQKEEAKAARQGNNGNNNGTGEQETNSGSSK